MLKKLPPAVAALLAYLAAILLVRPFGEYPLNDDWAYAWVTKRFAETGRFLVDVQAAPALFGQTLLATPWIRAFGFSHLLLRCVTIVLAAGLIFILDRILAKARVARSHRTAALVLIVLNPFFLNLSFSFMTEIYGFALGFAAVWLWFGESWAGAVAAGLVFGASFWVRQTAVLLLPCAALASFVTSIGTGRSRIVLARAAVAAAIAGAFAFGYFAWSRASGNLTFEFSNPLSHLTNLDWEAQYRGIFAFAIYMTAFLFPLLLLFPLKGLFARAPRVLLGIFVGAELYAVNLFYSLGNAIEWPAAWIQKKFPLLGNVIYNAGVGPPTLTDTYSESAGYHARHAEWPDGVWWVVYAGLIALLPIWIALFAEFYRRFRDAKPDQKLAFKVSLFGFLVGPVMTLVLVQAYGQEIFDRYHFPGFLGCALGVAALLGVLVPELSRRTKIAFAVLLVPLAFFAIAGEHDYFRWNDARWALVTEARSRGISVMELDAGHEASNWLRRVEHADPPPGHAGWNPWRARIVMNPHGGYQTLARRSVRGWLAPIPDMLLEATP